jgi:hypothetical protein
MVPGSLSKKTEVELRVHEVLHAPTTIFTVPKC